MFRSCSPAFGRSFLTGALSLAALAGPLAGQGQGEVDRLRPPGIALLEDATVGLDLGSVLIDPRSREALAGGLPIRIRIVTELWKDQLFDRQEAVTELSWTVLFDPLSARYRLRLPDSDLPAQPLDSIQELVERIEASYRPPAPPVEEGAYYYLATLELSALSLSDLGELQRWLRGELAPALTGPERVDDAVTSGLGRLVGRVLGLPTRRFRIRTEAFRIPRGPGQDADPR